MLAALDSPAEPVVITIGVAAAVADELAAEIVETFDVVEPPGLPPLPPLCDRQAHRDAGLDWLGHGGARLVCGVCHPPTRSRERSGLS